MKTTPPSRPAPQALLARLNAASARAARGKLKIFFGASAGVGKTYAMLADARQRLQAGEDVVVGVVETHGRPDTIAMLEGMPRQVPLKISHRGMELQEFDLDAALRRRPVLLLLDELAHTNASGLRHPKRWNDVDELLSAGIDVYTTLNVQHLESLSDIVAGITGIHVKETVPDAFFDQAEDLVLVDLNVDELLKRMAEGKVYVRTDVSTLAQQNFFKRPNLIALREMALRRTAERVDAQNVAYGTYLDAANPMPVAEKIMVCVGPDEISPKLVRTTRRIAAPLHAQWEAVYVETARHNRLSEAQRAAISQIGQLTERLGGKWVTLQGNRAVDEILAYAQSHRVTKIMVGKPIRTGWLSAMRSALADQIIRVSGDIDVYVVTGDYAKKPRNLPQTITSTHPLPYLAAVLVGTACTELGLLLHGFLGTIDQAMIYLAGTIFVAARLSLGASLLYALLSVMALNFFFVAPLYTFNVYDQSYWFTFVVMLVASLVISVQASKLRLQTIFARRREHATRVFYDLTRELASTRGHEAVAAATGRHIEAMMDAKATIWLPNDTGHVDCLTGKLDEADTIKETAVAQWCYEHGQSAGLTTNTLPGAKGFYLPLFTAGQILGVMGIIPASEQGLKPEERSALETFASLLSSALARVDASGIAEISRLEAEGEKLRNMLLSSISHDLRTPLASIIGAASSLVSDNGKLAPRTIQQLAKSIHQEALRLSSIIINLLHISSLESGAVKLNSQPYYIEEIIGAALGRVKPQLKHHPVSTHSQAELPMVQADASLIEQVLINLLQNAAQHTPEGTHIRVSAKQVPGIVVVSVADNGPGIPKGSEQKVFEKFHVLEQTSKSRGTGLGLAICAAIIKAHGGMIRVEDVPGGGADFSFSLPLADLSKLQEEPVQ